MRDSGRRNTQQQRRVIIVNNKIKRFWNFAEQENERILRIDGVIAEDSWLQDDITPKQFKSELKAGSGDITVWLNSSGGDVFAGSQIYNMLRDYDGKVTVKVDGLAASAASVIAMAGDEVLMSPVSLLMVHNPLTVAIGDSEELQKTIAMLDEIKESIINAYKAKTGLSRKKLSDMMNEESWLNAEKAVKLGFADGILFNEKNKEKNPEESFFEDYEKVIKNLVTWKNQSKIKLQTANEKPKEEQKPKPESPAENTQNIKPLYQRLNLLKRG